MGLTEDQDNVAARLNRFLTKAVPSYTDGEEEGIEHWLARFKFEYFWELSFTGLSQDHSDRMFFQERAHGGDGRDQGSGGRDQAR